MKGILYVLEHDFRSFFRYKFWLVGLVSMNLADLFIMAVVYGKMVDPVFIDYFKFFSPGITVLALFAAAFMIGREINFEVRRNFSHYLLSLPMTRLELAAGRVLAGGLRGMVYMSPLLWTTFFVVQRFPSPIELLIILVTLFFLATGTSGLSIVLAVSTKSFEKFVTSRGVVYYLLFFCSTVFYPLSSMQSLAAEGIFPQPLVTFAQINPLSSGADLIRAYLLPEQFPFSIDLLRNAVVFSLIFTLSASLAYLRIILRD